MKERSETVAQQEPADAPQLANEADNSNGNPLHATIRTSGILVEPESRQEGRVSLATYLTYFKAAGWSPWPMTLLLMLFIRANVIINQLYIAKWAEAYNSPSSGDLHTLFQRVTPSSIPILDDLPSPAQDVKPWILIYLAISLSGAFATLAYLGIGYWASLRASRTLFTAMLDRVSRAPTRFFDKTPIGRILNRFVADIGAVDGTLQASARNALAGSLNFIASLGVIIVIIPHFAPFALVIAYTYIKLAPPYVRASRDLRRLESISLSPAFSGFNEVLHGLVHIRAFGVESRYQDRFYNQVRSAHPKFLQVFVLTPTFQGGYISKIRPLVLGCFDLVKMEI
jgi:ABC-type multidrug transport system fused ATPase/permease subunit